MVCLACHQMTSGRVCGRCVATMRVATDRLLPGGLRLVAAFEHEGAAKALVHHLKYRGVFAYAELVAESLAGRLPRLPVVPVPRALSRRLKYGVDPARVIASCLARRLDVPVVEALGRPIHTPRRAGRDHTRPVSAFRRRSVLRFPAIVVDDVVTTGATALAAVDAIGADLAVMVAAANVVSDPPSLGARMTSPKPGVDTGWQAF